jgi:hypothetical protein
VSTHNFAEQREIREEMRRTDETEQRIQAENNGSHCSPAEYTYTRNDIPEKHHEKSGYSALLF